MLNKIKFVACFEKLIRGVFYNIDFYYIIPVASMTVGATGRQESFVEKSLRGEEFKGEEFKERKV